MTPSPLRRALVAIGAASLFGAAAPALGQSGAPLRVILPVAAGSGVDTIVRAAQNELSKALGSQPW